MEEYLNDQLLRQHSKDLYSDFLKRYGVTEESLSNGEHLKVVVDDTTVLYKKIAMLTSV